MAPYKRRLRFSFTKTQYRLLAFSLIYIFATVLVFAAALFLPLILTLQSRSLSPVDKQVVADQFLSIHARAWPAILIVLVLLGIHSLIVSHRIAGPLYRFRRSLRAIADGNLSTPAIIRQNDYLVTEAETINEMIASLRAKIEDIQEHCAEMHRVLSDVRRSIDSGSIESMSQDIESLGARMRRLKVCVDQFRTASVGTRGEGDFGGEVVVAPASAGPTINRL
jgi:methyl-accepting chemotaxis protein